MNSTLVQIIVTLLLSVPSFMMAIGNTWTSYALIILESEDSPLGYKITKNDGNLISSIIMLGSLVTILFAGHIADKIGRKRTEMLSGLCSALSWSIIATAKSVTQILIGRFLIGIGSGLHIVTGVVYVGEISQTRIRGSLLTAMMFMYNLGALVSYLEGWFCSYQVVNYLNLSTAVVFVLLLIILKETPVYLLRTGREKEAIKSLKFYRGVSTVTQEILDEIVYLKGQLSNDNVNNIDNTDVNSTVLEKEKLNQENETTNDGITEQKSAWSILRTTKTAQRALVILVIGMVLSVCMGMVAVQAFAGQFFAQAAPSISPHLCSVILAIVVCVASGLSVFLVDLIPRRVLMITTCSLAGGCMAWLASMLHWTWAPEWGIPLVMVFYCISFHLGTINIPVIQITETLPSQMNSFGTGVVMCSMFVANFAVLFVFKPAVDYLGLDGVFLLFAIISFATALVSFLTMRETRKVPFEIVQKMFENGYLYKPQQY
uniref:Major facilitator superfamily (MFS) profile domain-containing protein n=1 Tax=Heliothis virescens TaxID=7102 RepID=A0A2A4K0E5_HELVI